MARERLTSQRIAHHGRGGKSIRIRAQLAQIEIPKNLRRSDAATRVLDPNVARRARTARNAEGRVSGDTRIDEVRSA
jgi:hypothetical protein